jgi:hypothetical protein
MAGRTRDGAASSLMVVIPSSVTECALSSTGTGSSCLRESDAEMVASAVGTSNMDDAKKKTSCDSEKCVISMASSKIGVKLANNLIANNFKIDGPTDNSLLSNVNIDTTLQQWAARWKDFFAYNFNMLNYNEYNYQKGYVDKSPDTLATVNVGELYKNGFRTAACVINSDVYQNGGKRRQCGHG